MVHAILSAFLAALIAGSAGLEPNLVDADDEWVEYPYKIDYSAQQVGSRRDVITIYEYVEVQSYDYIGTEIIQTLSPTYSPKALNNFHFSQTFTTVITTSLSTAVKYGANVTTGLSVKAGVPGAEFSEDKSVTALYTIENTKTYTASDTTTLTVDFDLDEDKVGDNNFALCVVADVFRFACKRYEMDHYWWGDYVRSGTEEYFYSYVTVDPYITIVLNGWQIL
jgi:hypothetical protein